MNKKFATKIATCSSAVLLVAAMPLGAEQRSRVAGDSGTGSTAQATNSGRPVTNPPASYTDYIRLMQQTGNLTDIQKLQSGEPMPRPNFLPMDEPTGVPRSGMNVNQNLGEDPNGPCARPRLACKVFTSETEFDTTYGPFSRASGNYEDFELTNGPAGSLCTLDDGTKTPDADCRQSPDTFFGVFCTIAVDAGDILTGIGVDNAGSQRGNTFWEVLAIGSGFNGATNRYMLVNYFADTTDVFFVPDPACANGNPKPNAVGMHVKSPFGDPDALVTVDLSDGKQFSFSTGNIPTGNGKFIGMCCINTIDKVNINQGVGTPTLGVDEIKWKNSTLFCDTPLAPISLDDIACALDVIEAKLDSSGPTSGSTSKRK